MIIKRKRFISIVMVFTITLCSVGLTAVPKTYAAAKKKPARVSGLKIKAVNSDIKVTWKKAKYAKKYEVYYTSQFLGNVWATKKTKSKSFTFSQPYGAKCYVKIRGLNGKKKGKFSKTKSCNVTCYYSDTIYKIWNYSELTGAKQSGYERSGSENNYIARYFNSTEDQYNQYIRFIKGHGFSYLQSKTNNGMSVDYYYNPSTKSMFFIGCSVPGDYSTLLLGYLAF